ncbi:MAG TPA: OsmC family protein [Gammaproteobacteria bacterium]|nr:OsmC family protein [Gammaproteobacteria bacterium]
MSHQDFELQVHWERGEQPFLDGRYSRRHRLRFDGELEVPGSSSPQVVPVPLSDPAAMDPEEAFVASLSACHMLWFLAMASKYGFCVDEYRDTPLGRMGRNADGRTAMTLVLLRPAVRFSGARRPSPEEFRHMHHEAHEACFIANSVLTELQCDPVYLPG